MIMRSNDKSKARLVVYTYLCANKGKWITAKQLSDFLNENQFHLRFGLSSAEVQHLLTKSFLKYNNILYRKNGYVFEYCVNGGV